MKKVSLWLFIALSAASAGVLASDYTIVVSDTRVANYNEAFNVKAYGALGDSTTDDLAAFNLAIAAINSAGGGTLYLPPGEYAISDETTAFSASDVTIVGENATILWNSTTSEDYLFSFTEISSASGTLTAALARGDSTISTGATISSSNILSFKNGPKYFESAERNNKMGEQIILEDGEDYFAIAPIFAYASGFSFDIITPATGCEVIGITVIGSGTDNGTGVLDVQGAVGFKVRDCNFSDVNIGIALLETRDSSIIGCKFKNIDKAGSGYSIAANANNYNLSVIGNNADIVRHFFTTTGESGVTRKVLVSGNSVSRSRLGAIDTHAQGYDITISGNHISDSLTGINVRSPYSYIVGNVLHNCNRYPYPSEYASVSSKASQSSILTGEMGFINLTVSNNTIVVDTDISVIDGTTLYGSGIDIRSTDNDTTAVFTADYIRVTGNTVLGNSNNGGISIVTGEAVTDITITGNDVSQAPYNGIVVDPTAGTNGTVVIANNQTDGSFRTGYYSYNVANATNVFITNNTDSYSGATNRTLALDTVTTATISGNQWVIGMAPTLTSVTTMKYGESPAIRFGATAPTDTVGRRGALFWYGAGDTLKVYTGATSGWPWVPLH